MFYLKSNTQHTIYINRTLDLGSDYKLTFKNKDEYNVVYDIISSPSESNERFTSFIFDLTLKNGFYKFYIYDNNDVLIYNDICFIDFEINNTVIEDDKDKKIIIT